MKPKTPKTPGPVAVKAAAAGATDGDVTPKGKANARAKAAPARGPQGAAMPKPAAPKPAQRAGDRAGPTPAAKPPLAMVPDATDNPDTSAAGKTGMADALKMKDLIDQVAQATGGKKAAVRDVVEATLRILGDALSQGGMVNLPPFGKAKVSRMAEAGSGKPMIIKLRRMPATQGTGGGNPMQTLADPDD